LGVIIRNFLFDKKFFKSVTFNMPIICVGNLSVGGTGKSPVVEYLIRLLKDEFKIATVSRGYKRKTKGYVLARPETTALDIGDEPMQFHLKFPDLPVAVGEERIVAIPQLLHDHPDTDAIILDDAFQHRRVAAGLNILLTDYNNLFTRDFFLPTGDLRDQRASYKRAHLILVTKCPQNLSQEDKNKVVKEIKPLNHQKIFFTAIEYGTPYHIINKDLHSITEGDDVLLICGIANPKPLKNYLAECSKTYYESLYSDHHIFTIDDLNEINNRFKSIVSDNKLILTTEKDAVRLMKFKQELQDLPLYVIPVKHRFLFNEGMYFDESVKTFISNLKNNRAK
jgi:tetraacyldisaccharide 4'-kinase